MRKNKYHNKKTVWRGEKFDSLRERDRYAELLLLQRAGAISGLSRQVEFELTPNIRVEGKLYRKSVYVADFTYWENGKFIVEDCKGYRTDVYKLKKKLMLAKWGYLIRET